LAVYGTDAEKIREIASENPRLAEKLHPELPYIAAEIVWSARCEMSRTLDDALARRTRALLLNARATHAIAPRVARLLAEELGRDEIWIAAQVKSFHALAKQYILGPAAESTADGRA
jgi:glycerol-3-phosphate dehydrogenase